MAATNEVWNKTKSVLHCSRDKHNQDWENAWFYVRFACIVAYSTNKCHKNNEYPKLKCSVSPSVLQITHPWTFGSREAPSRPINLYCPTAELPALTIWQSHHCFLFFYRISTNESIFFDIIAIVANLGISAASTPPQHEVTLEIEMVEAAKWKQTRIRAYNLKEIM